MEGNEGPLEVKYCVAISKVSEYKSGNILVKTHPPLRVVILESPQIVNVNDSIFIADPPSQPQKLSRGLNKCVYQTIWFTFFK